MKKLILIIPLIISLICATVVYAALTHPSVVSVNEANAYQSVVVTNDQLHIITWELSDSANLTQPANETFLFRLYDDGVEIATSVPYPYYNDGYSQGITAFYFLPSDPDLPTWSSANLSVQLVGNPALDWGATIPSGNRTAWDSWTVGRFFVAPKIRTIGQQLSSVYSIDLTEIIQSVRVLTSEGEEYFEAIIPNLRDMSPELFSSATTQPDIPSENHTTTYGDTVEARWLTSGNGTFNMTNIGLMFGTSRNWALSIIYVVFCFVILYVVQNRISFIRGQGTGYAAISAVGMKPAMFLFGAMMILGSFMGFMVFEVGLFCGIFGGIALVFVFFWRGAA